MYGREGEIKKTLGWRLVVPHLEYDILKIEHYLRLDQAKNMLVPRFIKSAYRKEPVSSFVLIMGAVDAVIGGVGSRGTLFALGLMMVLGAVAMRWLQTQGRSTATWEEAPVRYLPMGKTQPPIPQLSSEKRRSSY